MNRAKNKELLHRYQRNLWCNQQLHFANAIPYPKQENNKPEQPLSALHWNRIDNAYELPIQSHNMDSTPSPTSSDSSSQFFASSPDFPPVPDHIVVTFDGKVREMLRITRDEVAEERQSRPTTSRPRYYAGRAFSRPESN